MEVASSRPDHQPTLMAAKTSELSLLVFLYFMLTLLSLHVVAERPMPAMLLRLSATACHDIEADHTDNGIASGCAYLKRERPHHGD